MLRALWPYLVVIFAIAAAAGIAYGAGTIGFPGVHGAIISPG